jgi:NOL1/NOP2/fmu family ribosome biogenesis protein
MGFIANKEKNFKKYLENHFGLVLPQDIEIFYAKGVRISALGLKKSHINGELSYAACDAGFNPTNALIQNFGHLAKKNIIDLEPGEAKDFASGKNMPADIGVKDKYIIMRYKGFIVGLGFYDKARKMIINKIPEKRRREIINEL